MLSVLFICVILTNLVVIPFYSVNKTVTKTLELIGHSICYSQNEENPPSVVTIRETDILPTSIPPTLYPNLLAKVTADDHHKFPTVGESVQNAG